MKAQRFSASEQKRLLSNQYGISVVTIGLQFYWNFELPKIFKKMLNMLYNKVYRA